MKSLCSIATKNQVQLHWVPVHMDIERKEETDSEAKRESEIQIYGAEPHLPNSLIACKGAVKEWIRKLHHYRWSNKKPAG